VLDEDRRRADELVDFVEEARASHRIAAPVALGYSNGANIAAATMLERPAVLARAILLRGMAPLSEAPPADLTAKPGLDRVRCLGSDRCGGERSPPGIAAR
jgi:phospholipase/carboxylesterase